MKIRLGTLRRILREEIMPRGGRSATTDSDAQVPGHLPNELPGSASLEETDEQVVGDGLGNGEKDPNEFDKGEGDIAQHLRGDEDKTSLGDPPDDVMEEIDRLHTEIRRYMLQEYPSGAGMVDPTTEPLGAYSKFDMTKDHTGTDNPSSTWYRSPGREQGTEGDPFRVGDPMSRLGFHPPNKKDTTSHPAVNGEEGIASRRAPEIWQLSGGGDTSKMLGANAHQASPEVESEDEQGQEIQGSEVPSEDNDEEESDETQG